LIIEKEYKKTNLSMLDFIWRIRRILKEILRNKLTFSILHEYIILI
jgi:hypothetical protein